MRVSYLLIFAGSFLLSCSTGYEQKKPDLFRIVSSSQSGVDFQNTLTLSEEVNPYTFKNFYNGGGVAIGDINNDGLSDIFLTGNQVSNRLYLNKGNLVFEDITSAAGLESVGIWSTGAAMVDINADGLLDIYVCKSGPPGGERRHNELFINTGDLSFTEEAANYGLNNTGLSVHASFFDFDLDGDLDCYLLNNAITSANSFSKAIDRRLVPDPTGGNKFYRNDDGFFKDITLESGIYSSDIGFGLAATIGDVNLDGWPDIYISNDFFEKDYLYINQKDGRFLDELDNYIAEISMGSMGSDFADINNDGYSEYFVTEMLPEIRERVVTKTYFETWNEQRVAQSDGYHNQFGRNTLQLNNRDGSFSEIGRLAGVEATDWSWSALIFDMDNDGYKDMHVTNGITRDLLDLDYLNFMSDREKVRNFIGRDREAMESIIMRMPSEALDNYFFHNSGNLQFVNQTQNWGLETKGFSNGAAYSDLDNDGDLDLVVNNINQYAWVFENLSNTANANNYLKIKLNGIDQNTMAIGAKVTAFVGQEKFYQEVNPYRGFESTVDLAMVMGLGAVEQVDSLQVVWPNQEITVLRNIEPDQVIELDQAESITQDSVGIENDDPIFKLSSTSFEYKHQESDFNDFLRDGLLYHMNSTEGPCACSADVNGDGLMDVYIGGASGYSGELLLQTDSGEFTPSPGPFNSNKSQEEVDCAFFHANDDQYLDLYVASGSSEFDLFSPGLFDKLYFGMGEGAFDNSSQVLPDRGLESSSVVLPFDLDGDGDLDLFVGGRSVPGKYGLRPDSQLLINDGFGNYSVAPDEEYEGLKNLGMVTDATVVTLMGQDFLVIVGRWMPVTIFSLVTTWSDATSEFGLEGLTGWYNVVESVDIDGDGNDEIFLGNHGLNSRFKASDKDPIQLLCGDFNNDGRFEQLISTSINGTYYPFTQLNPLRLFIPEIGKKFTSYDSYKSITTEQLLEVTAGKFSRPQYVRNLASGFLRLNANQKLEFQNFPIQAQLSPIYAFEFGDFTGDGQLDVLFGGNLQNSKPEVGSYMASFSGLLEGVDSIDFKFVDPTRSGLKVEGETRKIISMDVGGRPTLIFVRNNDVPKIFEIGEEK